jgi:hypothetical protein
VRTLDEMSISSCVGRETRNEGSSSIFFSIASENYESVRYYYLPIPGGENALLKYLSTSIIKLLFLNSHISLSKMFSLSQLSVFILTLESSLAIRMPLQRRSSSGISKRDGKGKKSGSVPWLDIGVTEYVANTTVGGQSYLMIMDLGR